MCLPRKILICIVIVLLIIATLVYGLFRISKSRTFQFFGEIIDRVETDEKKIALTFDDSPTNFTDDVLGILREKEVQATFYVIGMNAEEYPDQLEAIIEAGHELGNHSYSHKRFLLKSQSFIETEIETTNQILRDAGYTGEITFRPPNGKKLFGLPWYLAQNDIVTIMWNLEPDTYFSENSEGIVEYTLENIEPGSIILLHPFCETTCEADREAIPKIIDALEAEGYSFVTVSELLGFN